MKTEVHVMTPIERKAIVAELRTAKRVVMKLANVNRKQSGADSSLCDVAWGLETAAQVLAARIKRLTKGRASR